jgi:methionine aminopeptidase
MKAILLFVPALLAAAPAVAAPAAADPDVSEITRVLNDPRVADQMTSIARAMSKAVLDMPVGEIKAAVEGRAPTPADKRRTVRSETGMSEQQLDRQIAQAEPAIRNGMKAMSAAIPSMMQAMTGMAEAMERAMANMPDPTYPKR